MKTQTLLSTSVTPGRMGCKSRPMPTRRGRGSGFTLIELMITITIVGILASIGIPAYSSFVAGQRIKTASFDVMSTLMLARSEALKRNTAVTITPTGGNWASGWSVTVPVTVGGITQNKQLNQQAAFKKLTISGPVSLSYNSNGRLGTAVAPFLISDSDSSSARCIRIDLSGRPNSKKGGCS